MVCPGLALVHWQGSVRSGWRVAPLKMLQRSSIQQTRSPLKPPAQPGRITQCTLHHTCCTLQRLHLTLQRPIACPGLATHTLAGLCALWLRNAASSSGNLHKAGKPQPPQTTCCPALQQTPVQAPPHLLSTVEASFDHIVFGGMPRAYYSHTGRALCDVVAECCLLFWKSPQTGKTAPHINHLPSPATALNAGAKKL